MAVYDETQVSSQQVQPPVYPRPMVSSLDTWDQSTQIDYPASPTMPGTRPSWNLPSIAVTAETVNTIRASADTRFVAPTIATAAGMAKNPTTTNANTFRVVPNMAQNIWTDSSAQVNFSISITTATAGASGQFAIFRDGLQISQVYTGSGNVSGSYMDTTPKKNSFHTYDLRWRITTSAVTAEGTNRTFQVSNMRAQ